MKSINITDISITALTTYSPSQTNRKLKKENSLEKKTNQIAREQSLSQETDFSLSIQSSFTRVVILTEAPLDPSIIEQQLLFSKVLISECQKDSDNNKALLCEFKKIYKLIKNYDVFSEFQINEIKKFTKIYTNFIFNETSRGHAFLNALIERSEQRKNIPLIDDLILNPEAFYTYSTDIKNLIFKKEGGQPSQFEIMMTTDKANELFDIIVGSMNQDEINLNERMREQIYKFGFSKQRYDYIFFKEDSLSDEIKESVQRCLENCKIPYEDSILKNAKENINFDRWTKLRQEGSNSIDTRKCNSDTASRWNEADELRSEYAIKDRHRNERFESDRLRKMHLRLCKNELDAQPGKIRNGIVRSSGWKQVYCHHQLLESRLDEFWQWFNQGLKKCEEGEINPIIFAAQTYQRCVSLHPFHNGNGRISRLLMDYVLERFKLPPPVLGKDILDALFPLNTEKPKHEAFIAKIIQGIEESKQLIL